jgi:hypothetical protein
MAFLIYWLLLLSSAAGCLGCDRFGCDREQANPSPVLRRPPGVEEMPGARPAPGNRSESTREEEEKRRLMREMLASRLPEKQEEPGEGEERRDLEAELGRLVGNPVGCMKPRAEKEAPESIPISVEATVTTNGLISRTSVTSPNLSAEELECIDKRVASSHFMAPVEEAPRTVRTVVTVQRVGL